MRLFRSGVTSDDVKVKWNHYGKKTNLALTALEMETQDVFEVLLEKMRIVRPGFDDPLAYEDALGNQVYINNDQELRDAIHRGRGKVKVVSMKHPRPPSSDGDRSTPRSQRSNYERAATRSLSMPPPTTEYRVRGKTILPTFSLKNQRPMSRYSASPIPQSQASTVPYYPNQVALRSDTPKRLDADQVYTVYGPRYTASVLYGYPPTIPWIYPFLSSPFPFGGTYRYTGPNKHVGWSGWGGPWGSRYGYKVGWGPVW